MPTVVLPLALIAAIGAIAYWVVVRFPTLAPRSVVGVTGWLVAAVALTLSAQPTFAALGSVAGPIAALVIVEIASGVCVMLAVAWTAMWVIRAGAH